MAEKDDFRAQDGVSVYAEGSSLASAGDGLGARCSALSQRTQRFWAAAAQALQVLLAAQARFAAELVRRRLKHKEAVVGAPPRTEAGSRDEMRAFLLAPRVSVRWKEG